MTGQTVLIIEDDIRTQKVYYQKLTNKGYDVILAPTAKEAISDIINKKPAIILLDIMLAGSGMNGFDVLEFMKKKADYSKIPVIVLTNLDSESKVREDIGAVEYLVKANISIDDVVKKVAYYIK